MAVRPLDPSDRVAHFTPPTNGTIPSDAPQPYEWWYFELHFPGPLLDSDGEPLPGDGPGFDDWVVVLSTHLPHFMDPVRLLDVKLGSNSRGEGMQVRPTFDYTGLAISIYRLSPTEPLMNTLVGFSATRTAHAVASTSGRFSARWGRDSPIVTIEESEDGRSYAVDVAARGWWASRGLVDTKFRGRKAHPLAIDLQLEFAERSPGFKIDDGVLVRDRWGGEHHWVLRMPNARVRGKVRLHVPGRGPPELDATVDATGYHDHQWGPYLPMDVMKEWSWGRVLVRPDERPDDEDLMVFFRSTAMDDDTDSAPSSEGVNILAYVPAHGPAVELTPDPGRKAVTSTGWDRINYPLRAFDPAQVTWPEARPVPDAFDALSNDRSREGPPFFVPDDDSISSFWWWLLMLFGRALARKRLREEIGYWGALSCQGRGPTGIDNATQEHHLVLLQRATGVEPWPFYNRYVPKAAALRDGERRDRISFALSEYMEVYELLHLRPPRMYKDKPIYEDLLGMGLFSEFMTTIEDGAPKLRELLRHFG